jgi:hypothetical protein
LLTVELVVSASSRVDLFAVLPVVACGSRHARGSIPLVVVAPAVPLSFWRRGIPLATLSVALLKTPAATLPLQLAESLAIGGVALSLALQAALALLSCGDGSDELRERLRGAWRTRGTLARRHDFRHAHGARCRRVVARMNRD